MFSVIVSYSHNHTDFTEVGVICNAEVTKVRLVHLHPNVCAILYICFARVSFKSSRTLCQMDLMSAHVKRRTAKQELSDRNY